jgi:branched-chain amino acid transport system permease protein
MDFLNLVGNQVFSGLVRGALYFLVTSGLSLLFGVVGVLNMAHFSLYMIASYVTWSFSNLLQDYAFSFWAASILSALVMCGFAWIIERLIIKHVYERALPDQLFITFAMVYVFEDLTKIFWGSLPLVVKKPDILAKSLDLGGHSFPMTNVFVVVLGIAIGLGLWVLLAKTRIGRILRAAYSHKEMITALGVPIHRVYAIMFILSVLLVSIAGSAWTMMGIVEQGQGHSILIESFCVMVIGGMGSLVGTALSSVLCGMTYALAILFIPKMAPPLIFFLAGVILLIRPWGLMGKVGRPH